MVILLLLLLSVVSVARLENPPHIVFILADDFGWNDVSFHGSPQIPTPNIDSLAFSGVPLQNYYVTPLCSPSRSAIMTGKYPIHTGMQHDVIYANQGYGLPLEEKILPQYLKDLGYSTHAVGKWHLGYYKKEHTPLYRGFDSHFGYWTGHKDYYDHTAMGLGMWGLDLRNNMSVEQDYFGNYTTRLFTGKAVDVIRQHDGSKPLFLYVAHLAVHSANPHTPLQAPEETVAKFQHIKDPNRRLYAAMVHELDQSVVSIVKALDDKGYLKNSIIVFSTDNGGPAAGFNQNAASNWPLKGVKNTPWEGGVRGVGLVWSSRIPPQRRGMPLNYLMDVSDWLPTLYEAAGGNFTSLGHLDGTSHWKSVLFDMEPVKRHTLHNIDDGQGYAALRKDQFKLVVGTTYSGQWDDWYGPSGRDPSQVPHDEIETNSLFDESPLMPNFSYENLVSTSQVSKALFRLDIKLPTDLAGLRRKYQVDCGIKPVNATPCHSLKSPCLFNVIDDPCEYVNLAADLPDIVGDLTELLKQYNASAVPPLNTPGDPKANPRYYGYVWTNWADY